MTSPNSVIIPWFIDHTLYESNNPQFSLLLKQLQPKVLNDANINNSSKINGIPKNNRNNCQCFARKNNFIKLIVLDFD